MQLCIIINGLLIHLNIEPTCTYYSVEMHLNLIKAKPLVVVFGSVC